MKNILRYWVPHSLLLFMMVGSGIYYVVDTPTVAKIFNDLGYPTYTLYFNAIAKFLGGIAIIFPVHKTLKEWAYAGYLFIILLALQAVWMRMPGIPFPIIICTLIWSWAYYEWKRTSKA